MKFNLFTLEKSSISTKVKHNLQLDIYFQRFGCKNFDESAPICLFNDAHKLNYKSERFHILHISYVTLMIFGQMSHIIVSKQFRH